MEQLFIEMLHYGYLCLWPATADGKITRDWPIMLIFLPIILCCSAHKIYLLCSKLCSRIRIVLSLLSRFMYKFSWISQFI